MDVCDGKWHHLAMTHDGKAVRLFVDGKNVKEQAVAYRPDAKPEPGPLLIGGAYVGDQHIGCDGLIDDVRISTWRARPSRLPTAALAARRADVDALALDGDEGISADINWTPPTPEVGAEPWEIETDKDWIDDRFRRDGHRPVPERDDRLRGPKGKVRSYKATAIKVGDKGEATVLFDRNQLRFAAAWTGGFLNTRTAGSACSTRRRRMGRWCSRTSSLAGWADEKGNFESSYPPTAPLPKEWAKFQGSLFESANADRISYSVGGTRLLELY